MLSPTMQRISSFPFTPINKPPLSEEVKKRVSESLMDPEDCSELKEVTENSQKGGDIPALKVIIKEFAKQSMKEKENLPLNNNNENMTKEKRIENSEDVADVIEDEDPNEEGEDQTDSPGEDLDEPVSPPPSDSNHVILIEDDEEPGTNEESSNTVASGKNLDTQNIQGWGWGSHCMGGPFLQRGGQTYCRSSKVYLDREKG